MDNTNKNKLGVGDKNEKKGVGVLNKKSVLTDGYLEKIGQIDGADDHKLGNLLKEVCSDNFAKTLTYNEVMAKKREALSNRVFEFFGKVGELNIKNAGGEFLQPLIAAKQFKKINHKGVEVLLTPADLIKLYGEWRKKEAAKPQIENKPVGVGKVEQPKKETLSKPNRELTPAEKAAVFDQIIN